MVLCGKPGLQFKCREYTCVLNDGFNVVLYTEHTVLQNGTLHPLGFVVPTHYLSFIKTIDSRYDLQTSLLEIFQFERPQDAESLTGFVRTQQPHCGHTAIPDLGCDKKHARKTKLIKRRQ